ncbi:MULTISPECIES: structural cement protein Gp24 [Gammaproteobacteria]|uniref:structural cement protein Gp24 n=1 Tax=Gammaproteobacteria TaxID=1236 RepID=UPI002FC9C6ED
MSDIYGVKTSFTRLMGNSYAGQISGTGLYNINGNCVAKATVNHSRMEIGRAVYRDNEYVNIDGSVSVSLVENDGEVPYGVAVRSSYQTPTGVANDGDGVNVMSYGKCWMVISPRATDDHMHYGSPVAILPGHGVAITDDIQGGILTKWFFTGSFHKLPRNESNEEFGEIAEVMIVPSKYIAPIEPPKPEVVPYLSSYRLKSAGASAPWTRYDIKFETNQLRKGRFSVRLNIDEAFKTTGNGSNVRAELMAFTFDSAAININGNYSAYHGAKAGIDNVSVANGVKILVDPTTGKAGEVTFEFWYDIPRDVNNLKCDMSYALRVHYHYRLKGSGGELNTYNHVTPRTYMDYYPY